MAKIVSNRFFTILVFGILVGVFAFGFVSLVPKAHADAINTATQDSATTSTQFTAFKGVPVYRLLVTNSGDVDDTITSLSPTPSGSVVDTHIRLHFYHDANDNGIVDEGDTNLGVSALIAVDDTQQTFNIDDVTVPANGYASILITADGSGLANSNFFILSFPAAVDITMGSSTISGGAPGAGSTLTVTNTAPSLTIANGANDPASSTATASETGVVVKQLSITTAAAGTADSIVSLAITPGGSEDDTNVSNTKFYIDSGITPGAIDSGDIILEKSPATYTANNGKKVFTFTSPIQIAGGSSVKILYTYDLGPDVVGGRTLTAQLVDPGDAVAGSGVPVTTNNSTVSYAITIASARYWVGGGSSANWDAVGLTNWSATSGGANNASVPGVGDDVFFDGAGNSPSTLNTSFNIDSLDMTGYTNTLTHANGVALNFVANGGTHTVKFAGTYVLGGLNTAIDFDKTTTAATYNFTTGGKTFGYIYVNPELSDSTVVLQDTLNIASTNTLDVRAGTFDANNQNLSIGKFNSSNANTRTITMGSGTWTLTGVDTPGLVWDITTTTGLTVNSDNSTIKFTNASSAARTFSGGGKIYNIIWFNGGANSIIYIMGGNTFYDFIANTEPHYIAFAPSTTTTVNLFSVSGTAGNLITMISQLPGTPFTLSKDTGNVDVDYVSLQDSAATTTNNAVWRAGPHSVDVSGNSGWFFYPTAFTTGAITTTGGTVVAGKWNSTNTGVDVTVPVSNQSTLTGGTIQVKANRGDGFINLGSVYTILVGDLGTSKTFSFSTTTFEALTNFAEGDTWSFTAVITDTNTLVTTGTQSATTLFVDQIAPTVVITVSQPLINIADDGDPFNVIATFNEPITESSVEPGFSVDIVGPDDGTHLLGQFFGSWNPEHTVFTREYVIHGNIPLENPGIDVTVSGGHDLAGNLMSATTTNDLFDVDTIAPTISIGSPSLTLTSSTDVTYTVTYTGANVVLLTPGNILLNGTGTATGTIGVVGGTNTTTSTVTISGITGDGTLGITIGAGVASDTAGNTSTSTGPSATSTVDNTAPSGYTVNFDQAYSTSTSSSSLSFTFAGAEIGATYAYSLTDSTSTTATATGTISTATDTISGVDASSLADGTLILSVTLTDLAENSGAAATDTIIQDATLPALSAVSLLSNNASTTLAKVGDTITLTATSSETLASFTVVFTSGGAPVANSVSYASSTNTWTASYVASSSDTTGALTFTIDFTDLAANGGTQVTATTTGSGVAFDKTAPTISIGSPSLSLTSSTDVTYTITYTGADTVTLADINITLNTTGTVTADYTGSGTGTSTRTVTLSNITGDGTLGISIAASTASDTTGNLALAAGPSATSTVDNTAPSTPAASPVAGAYSSVQSVTLSSAGSTNIRYTVDGSTPSCSVGLTANPVSVSSSETIKAIGCDTAGNGSSVSFVYTISIGGGGSAGAGGSYYYPTPAPASTSTTPIVPASTSTTPVVTQPITPVAVIGMTNAQLQTLLNQLLAQLQTLIAQTQARGIKLSPGLLVSTFVHDLKLGATHDDAKALQAYLNGHGFIVALSGAGSKWNETRYFGPATRKALAAFQASVGISPAVGYFGPLTREYANSHP